MTAASLFAAPLPAGGTIGVPAPASPYDNRSEILRGVQWWESKGYRVKLGAGVFSRAGYVAGEAEARARDLVSLFADPEVDAIQCLRGGYGSAQLIPYLDFEAIAANPKPFLGFSDITALHVAIRQRTGLATFYAPGLAGVGDPATTGFTRERLLAVLRGSGAGRVPADPDDPYVRPLRGGKATGPLVGGCLWLLMQTMGTPWEIDLEDALFFFEDYEAAPWHIEGMLTQLAHAGKLAGVRGVVVGELEKCDWDAARPAWPNRKSLEDVLEEHLEPLGVPVLYKLPLGHGKHLAAVPLGVQATVDADTGALTLEESGLTPGGEGEPK